jgi:hypothetical protein
MHGQPKGWLGLSVAARSSRGAARVPMQLSCAPGVLAAWSPCAARAQDDAVTWLPTGRWWLAGRKVLPARSWEPPGGHRARRGLVGLTEGSNVTKGQRGQLGMVVFRWRAALAIVDTCGEVLQLEGDKGVRKWRLLE